MRIATSFIGVRALSLLVIALLAFGCASEKRPETPTETFKAYITAAKKKDTTQMKLLLSAGSIKMNEQEAKSRNVTLDDIVKQETLFSEGQNLVKFRNEKIDGDKATLEVQNTFGSWETVPFLREDGEWKIDKKGYADRLMQDIDQSTQELDDIINQGKNPNP